MDEDILYEVNDGVATITFNRPDKLNAITPEMGRRYPGLLVQAEEDPDVRVVVLTGAGRAFCAGGDTNRLAEATQEPTPVADPPPPDAALRVTKPMIAAVNGSAAGVGLLHALACDVRFVSSEAKLTFAFSRYGLVAEFDASWLVPRMAGTGRALDLLLTSRRFSGQDAYDYGLAEYVTEPGATLKEAHAYARGLVTDVSAYSLLAIKRQVYENWARSRAEALDVTLQMMRASMTESDFSERVKHG